VHSRPEKKPHDGLDLGQYCRSVEEHLARVNEGHIIRIVGPAFELVRSWATEGIPLAVVYRGIEQKAERHRAGRSKRPLRLEFCEDDVRAVYDEWRRAVGLWSLDEGERTTGEGEAAPTPHARRPSAVRELDRVVDRLSAAAGRLDESEAFRTRVAGILAAAIELREEVRRTRGDARRALAPRAADLDHAIADAAMLAEPEALARARAEAIEDLAPFRGRLTPDAWERAIDRAVDRLMRARRGLPVIDPAWIDPTAGGGDA